MIHNLWNVFHNRNFIRWIRISISTVLRYLLYYPYRIMRLHAAITTEVSVFENYKDFARWLVRRFRLGQIIWVMKGEWFNLMVLTHVDSKY